MAHYTAETIASIVQSSYPLLQPEAIVSHLVFDSRKNFSPDGALFVALTNKRDGHQYIPKLIEQGCIHFLVEKIPTGNYKVNFYLVPNSLNALQDLAKHHRIQFQLPIIGITGSNGKTIVKEWLYQLCSPDYTIVRSPKSFNSKIGVPLSVWEINHMHTLGIFEAGISTVGEMEQLQMIIQPTLGILTNIGSQHDDGFKNRADKLHEKLLLFKNNCPIVYPYDLNISNPTKESISWSFQNKQASIFIKNEEIKEHSTLLKIVYQDKLYTVEIPFKDKASIENAVTCFGAMCLLHYPPEVIVERLYHLFPVGMRLELIEGLNQCTLINDSYSADLESLEIALEFLQLQNQHPKKTVILSDIHYQKILDKDLYTKINFWLKKYQVSRIIVVGKNIQQYASIFEMEHQFFGSTEEFIAHPPIFNNESILIKGARAFAFERIERLLSERHHETTLEINLNALIHNLNYFRSKLLPSTKIMAMVKAFGYGAGSREIASVLEFMKVDYLAVAYADEGIELRKKGIQLPIMVMSPEQQSFSTMAQYHLEPEIYSLRILKNYVEHIIQFHPAVAEIKIHLKVETGMKRLGIEFEELNEVIEYIKAHSQVKVESVFTHLVGSEKSEHDEFSKHQLTLFEKFCNQLHLAGIDNFIKHLSNTAAALRFKEFQQDMVRIGIGLYGVDPTNEHSLFLQPLAKLTSTITQIKKVLAGESIGYNRGGISNHDRLIAVVKIGYADGFSRKLGNGNGYMIVNNTPCKIVGNVCMDMTMIDVTGVNCSEQDEVIVMGEKPSVYELATACETIPYEILTSFSQRLKRVYVFE